MIDKDLLLLDFKTQSYLAVNLTDGNQYHFQNATLFQKDPVAALKANNTEDYISFLQNAYDEFLAIHL